MLAKQSTALTLIVGPILDSVGVEYASAVIGDLSISKNGGTLTAMAAAATLTYIANGMYTLVTTTGNTDTLGVAQITCNKSTYQMPMIQRQIVPANVYDSLVLGSDYLDISVVQLLGTAWLAPATAGTPDVNVKLISGDSAAADNAEAFFDGTGYAAANNAVADAILSRNASNVEATAGEHTLCTVILAMLENSISGTTLTIKRTDGSTTHATKTLTVNAAADPITGIT